MDWCFAWSTTNCTTGLSTCSRTYKVLWKLVWYSSCDDCIRNFLWSLGRIAATRTSDFRLGLWAASRRSWLRGEGLSRTHQVGSFNGGGTQRLHHIDFQAVVYSCGLVLDDMCHCIRIILLLVIPMYISSLRSSIRGSWKPSKANSCVMGVARTGMSPPSHDRSLRELVIVSLSQLSISGTRYLWSDDPTTILVESRANSLLSLSKISTYVVLRLGFDGQSRPSSW